jgi:aspartyl-tRNA(Asn)/glutamyl-tRNA(Gln) amidotransferase subunit A
MTPGELTQLTLAEAARRIRAGDLSPIALTRAVLDRIERLNPQTNAFITVTSDLAMRQAEAAEQAVRNRTALGPLHGVPVSLKDLIDTEGIPTTAASRVLADRVPSRDASVWRRLRAAGAVLVGKTNLHEFAFGVTNVNPHYGAARNPWNRARMSGGSSGGSAVSVALSMALGSLGSDTGGSIRIPSALCGTVGLKPTYGRVSVAGVIPLSVSLDHVGPITRTVEDAAIMLESIAGFDPDDPNSVDVPVRPYSQELNRGIQGVRFGVPRNAFFQRLDPDVASAVEAALNVLEKLGAELVQVDVPNTTSHEAIFRHIATSEVFDYHEGYLETDPELYGEGVRERMLAGREMLAVDYVRFQRERKALSTEVGELFGTVDLLVLPALPITAPGIEETTIAWSDGAESLLSALTRNTRLANLTGLPAISVPCGFSRSNLPIGLQMIGREFEESTALNAAYAYEQDAGWCERRPEISKMVLD